MMFLWDSSIRFVSCHHQHGAAFMADLYGPDLLIGVAYRTAEHTFVVDPADPLVPGFVLR